MPSRLVYAPKAYVYTKQQSGAILDLTQYVTAGQVDRKINQVSTAQVTLRNPQKMFSKPTEEGVAFHPMDPITIYLERIKGFPVRVFTGYLDTTPYYQLYPGTVSLSASCTLKRLLYTYFDPSLPFVYAFFYKYGWTPMGDGTALNTNALTQTVGKNGSLQDSSLGKLLWAILYDIGQWQDSNIYIENLPSDLVQKVAALASNLKGAQQAAVSDFEVFLKEVIGNRPQGSGGGSGNTSTSSSGGGKAPSGTSGKVPNTPAGGYTQASWASALCLSLGVPTNSANVNGIYNWEQQEGGHWHNSAKYNPLCTTQAMAGDGGTMNSAGVRIYTSWEMGLKATVQTLNNGHYPNIIKDLQAGQGNKIGGESDMNTWGTGNFDSSVTHIQPTVGSVVSTVGQGVNTVAQRGTQPLHN